jgi:predicted CXXCH cytochrome family protein
MQLFWIPSIPGNLQVDLPFMYLLDDHRWVPELDTFLRDPNLTWHAAFWNQNCLQCHTTAGNPGVRPAESSTETQVGGMTMDTRLGEMGIGCESCHGPAFEHTEANENPLRRYMLHFGDKADTTIVNPARLSSKATSEVCGQCHSIHGFDKHEFFTNGLDYRPGGEMSSSLPIVQPSRASSDRTVAAMVQHQPDFVSNHFWSDGVVRVSGRDYNGLIDSPCYKKGELSCLSCHSMHDNSSSTNQLSAGMEGNQACMQCHTQFKETETLVEHTHHPADSSGSSCYNCHMPYTTYGLLKAIRSHTIESPSVATCVATGRPVACNLCHLDQSLKWTDEHLVQWYGAKPTTLTEDQKTTSASALLALRGDAGQRAIAAWAMGWPPARQASGERWLVPYLSQLLVDPYPAVRYIAGHSLQKVKGYEDFQYDFIGSPADRERSQSEAIKQWLQGAKPEHQGANVLIMNDGRLQDDKFKAFLQQRDDHSMNLQE